MGKADRENWAKPGGGLGKRRIFLLARFFTASRSFRSSSLTESLAGTGYSRGLEKRIIKSSYQYSLARVKSNHKARRRAHRTSTVQMNRSTVMGR